MEPLTSCTKKDPFIELNPDGKASILDYNLPQSTCYRATSKVNLNFDLDFFKISERRPPARHFWSDYVLSPLMKYMIKLMMN